MAKSTRSLKRAQRPRKMRKVRGVVHSTGPRELQLAQAPRQVTGPGEPPPNFVGGNTSRSEWFIYWALAEYFNDPPNPRVPPFFGGRLWGYQITAIDSTTGKIGSANVDFVVYAGIDRFAIRVETSRYHINTNAMQQAFDQIQTIRVARYYKVYMIYEQDFINDPSGQAAMQVVKEILTYGQSNARPAPIASARAVRIRS